jgi:hypothetical protein
MARYKTKKQKLSQSTKLYQKVRRATAREFKKRKIEISNEELTEFIKEKVYPDFKGLNPREVKVKDIREFVGQQIEGKEESNFYNPLLLSIIEVSGLGEANLLGIDWWSANDYVQEELTAATTPFNLRFEFNAGITFGTTGIIELIGFDYVASGLQGIIENIREDVDDKSGPVWNARVLVRKGFKDDGKADSYFLQFFLTIDEVEIPVTETIEEVTFEIKVPQLTLAERRKKRSEFVKKKKDIQKQRKQLEREKKMRTRPRPSKKEEAKEKEKPKKEAPKEVTETDLKRQENIDKLFERQEKLLAEARQDFKDKIFTKKEYMERVKAIENQINLALSKFGEGGKV